MCANTGVALHYFPPYSPDFNPIEESFSCLKAWIKRNRILVKDFALGGWEEFLHLVLNQYNIGGYAPKYFEYTLVNCS